MPAACPDDYPAVGALSEWGGWHGHPPGLNAFSPANRTAAEDWYFKGKFNKHLVTTLLPLKSVVIFKWLKLIINYSCSFSSSLKLCPSHNSRRKAHVFSGLQRPQAAISLLSDTLPLQPHPRPGTDVTANTTTFQNHSFLLITFALFGDFLDNKFLVFTQLYISSCFDWV